jgi:hypothetical protein
MSMGIKTKMDPESANIDLDEVLNKKLTKIEKRTSISPVKMKEDTNDKKAILRSSIANVLLKNSVKNRI